ncbi:MAG: hypothetical protein J6A89_01300 [Clostridia bacterium]|nr:hypothetical protein [Clostridia bacterium]
MQKGFISPDGKEYSTQGLHEELAREICNKKELSYTYSAEDALICSYGYIKVSNYSTSYFQYVMVSRTAKPYIKRRAEKYAQTNHLRYEEI